MSSKIVKIKQKNPHFFIFAKTRKRLTFVICFGIMKLEGESVLKKYFGGFLMAKKLVYDIHDKPKFPQLIVFALQQLLAIIAATITVPMIVGNGMSTSAALFGAGVGTLIYQLCTKFRSPVFLGSSFAFIGPMLAAFAGAL